MFSFALGSFMLFNEIMLLLHSLWICQWRGAFVSEKTRSCAHTIYTKMQFYQRNHVTAVFLQFRTQAFKRKCPEIISSKSWKITNEFSKKKRSIWEIKKNEVLSTDRLIKENERLKTRIKEMQKQLKMKGVETQLGGNFIVWLSFSQLAETVANKFWCVKVNCLQ